MNNKFSWQSFISIGLLFSFLIMFVSGLVLYIAPEGSLSRWIGWDVFNLTKKQWEHQHTIFSYLFILFSVFHIFKINWSLLLSYLSPEKLKFSNVKEIVMASIIVLFVFIGTLFNINPFKYVINLGSDISDSYSENVLMPEISDAEKLNLAEFADKVFNVSYDEMEKVLIDLKFQDVQKETIIMDFCKSNEISPENLYKIISGQLIKFEDSNKGAPDVVPISSFVGNKYFIL